MASISSMLVSVFLIRGYVVCDTVHPGSQRTSFIKMPEATPQLQMNVLEQVTTSVGVRLIRARQPVERGTVGIGRLFVQIILAHEFTTASSGRGSVKRLPHAANSFHTKVVAAPRTF
jgi:hypothetical protein